MNTTSENQLTHSQLKEIKELVKDIENLPAIKSKINQWKEQGFAVEELESIINPVYTNFKKNRTYIFTNFDKFLIVTGILFFIFLPITRFLFLNTNTFYQDRILWILSENIVGLSLCAYPFFKVMNNIKMGLNLSFAGYLIGILSFLIISGMTHTFLRIVSTILILFIVQNYVKSSKLF